MRTSRIAGFSIAALSLMLLATPAALARGDDDDGGLACRAKLAGANEVPAVVTDTDGKWQGKVNRLRSEIEFELKVRDGIRIQQSHFHCGVAGVNGPIVVFLAGNHPLGMHVDGKWIDNATVTDTSITNTACGTTISALVDRMLAGGVYVNVHSVQFPGGVIRGQVECSEGDDDD